jgi:DNA mismatch repair protein MutS
VPGPVVDRSREVLDRLREQKAVEARGGGGEPVQAVFDLSAGEFRREGGSAGDRGADAAAADGGDDPLADFGDQAPAVLAALADLDVNETPPVELMAQVQELQERLGGE